MTVIMQWLPFRHRRPSDRGEDVSTARRSLLRRFLFAALLATSLATALLALRHLAMEPGLVPPTMRGNFERKTAAFVLHAVLGGIALAVGAVQVAALRRVSRSRSVTRHRLVGWTYVLAVAAAAPTSVPLAFDVAGGASAAAGFLVLASSWLASTVMAVGRARRGDLAGHQLWMIRSYGLAATAITIRVVVPVGLALGFALDTTYAAAPWIVLGLNLSIAEPIARSSRVPVRAVSPRLPERP